MKKKLTIKLHNFWPGANESVFCSRHPEFSKLRDIQSTKHLTPPDLHIVTNYKVDAAGRVVGKFLNSSEITYPDDGAPVLFYSAERIAPDYSKANWSISFENNTSKKNLYLPNWIGRMNQSNIDTNALILSKRTARSTPADKFCTYIYRNCVDYREQLARALSGYKEVDCPGRSLNNHSGISADVNSKLQFCESYKFNLAMENENYPFYITEKIVDAFLSRTLPIYVGNSHVHDSFNSSSFVDATNKSTSEVLEIVRDLDMNKQLYLSTINEPPLKNNVLPEYCDSDYVTDFLLTLFAQEGI